MTLTIKKTISLLFIPVLCLTCGMYPSASFGAYGETSQKWYGVSRSGAEFTPEILPGTEGVEYLYPTDPASFAQFQRIGLKLIRVPFLWERIQPQNLGKLESLHIQRLQEVLDSAEKTHTKVLLDLHNYGRYQDRPLKIEDWRLLADVWVKILAAVGNHPALYGIELMNEPHDLPDGSKGWRTIMQNTVYTVRAQNQNVTIVVPGYSWQSARFWKDNNNELLIHDPADKLLYGAHQYFDDSYTGTYQTPTIGPASRGSERIMPFIDWLRFNKVRGIITEFGAPETDTAALRMMDNMLETVDQTDELVGAIYWSSGPLWGDYPLSIEPESNGETASQTAILANYPTRTNPVSLPKGTHEGDFIRFRNSETIFLVEKEGLRPFGTQMGYEIAKSKSGRSKLFFRLDTPNLYTVRWQTVESAILWELP